MEEQYMGIDQYGNTYHGLKHPRKDLMAKLGYRSAQRMFKDKRDGTSVHTGYVVGPYWVDVVTVTPWERPA